MLALEQFSDGAIDFLGEVGRIPLCQLLKRLNELLANTSQFAWLVAIRALLAFVHEGIVWHGWLPLKVFVRPTGFRSKHFGTFCNRFNNCGCLVAFT